MDKNNEQVGQNPEEQEVVQPDTESAEEGPENVENLADFTEKEKTLGQRVLEEARKVYATVPAPVRNKVLKLVGAGALLFPVATTVGCTGIKFEDDPNNLHAPNAGMVIRDLGRGLGRAAHDASEQARSQARQNLSGDTYTATVQGGLTPNGIELRSSETLNKSSEYPIRKKRNK